MAKRMVKIDRNTPMLLPPDMQEWLPQDHPARLVVELVESLDLSSASINERGSGSEQYPPSMMLALLLYCYSNGIFSSRKMEALTRSDVAVRYICALHCPDHDTICKFRRENAVLIREAFSQSLGLASEMGILEIGSLQVAMDGTKLKAKTRQTRLQAQRADKIDEELQRLEQQKQALEAECDELLLKAEETDRREAHLRSNLPEELQDPSARAEKLKEAKAMMAKKERRRARLEAAKAGFGRKKAKQSERRRKHGEAVAKSEVGSPPRKKSGEVKESDEINVADPDATKFRTYNGSYLQGYNAQAMVDMGPSGLLLGVRVSQESSDRNEWRENVEIITGNLGEGAVETIVADAGYDNAYHIHKIESETGMEVLCDQQPAKEKAASGTFRMTARRRKTRQWREQYREKLEEETNRKIRHRRRSTIEPAFGVIKEQMGFRQFSLRGLTKVELEWDLVALAYNLRKLFRNPVWKAQFS